MADDKLDLLKKLTRLANNNPNENEANLAARRVCKMLEEIKWALPNGPVVPPPIPPRQPSQPAHNPFEGYEWRGFDWDNPSYRPFRKEEQDFNKEREEQERKVRDAWLKDEMRRQAKNFYKDFREAEGTNLRRLKCKKCGNERQTGFQGDPSQFICFLCQFREHNF